MINSLLFGDDKVWCFGNGDTSQQIPACAGIMPYKTLEVVPAWYFGVIVPH